MARLAAMSVGHFTYREDDHFGLRCGPGCGKGRYMEGTDPRAWTVGTIAGGQHCGGVSSMRYLAGSGFPLHPAPYATEVAFDVDVYPAFISQWLGDAPGTRRRHQCQSLPRRHHWPEFCRCVDPPRRGEPSRVRSSNYRGERSKLALSKSGMGCVVPTTKHVLDDSPKRQPVRTGVPHRLSSNLYRTLISGLGHSDLHQVLKGAGI